MSEWAPVASCQSELEAKIIQGKLEVEGLQTKLDSDSLGHIYPGTLLEGPIQIYVKKDDLSMAREILNS